MQHTSSHTASDVLEPGVASSTCMPRVFYDDVLLWTVRLFEIVSGWTMDVLYLRFACTYGPFKRIACRPNTMH